MVIKVRDRVKIEKGIFKRKIMEGVITDIIQFRENDGGLFDFDLKHIYVKLDCGKTIKIVSQNEEYLFEKYRILDVI